MIYELATFPPALFEEDDVLWKANKPQLAREISDPARDAILDLEFRTAVFVLDNGSFLQSL